jgi:hypothetical protein
MRYVYIEGTLDLVICVGGTSVENIAALMQAREDMDDHQTTVPHKDPVGACYIRPWGGVHQRGKERTSCATWLPGTRSRRSLSA